MFNRLFIARLVIIGCLLLTLFTIAIGAIFSNKDEDINPPTGDPAMYTEYNNNPSN